MPKGFPQPFWPLFLSQPRPKKALRSTIPVPHNPGCIIALSLLPSDHQSKQQIHNLAVLLPCPPHKLSTHLGTPKSWKMSLPTALGASGPSVWSAACFVPPAVAPGISLSNTSWISLFQVYSRVHMKAKWRCPCPWPTDEKSHCSLGVPSLLPVQRHPLETSLCICAALNSCPPSMSQFQLDSWAPCWALFGGFSPSLFILIHKPTHP